MKIINYQRNILLKTFLDRRLLLEYIPPRQSCLHTDRVITKDWGNTSLPVFFDYPLCFLFFWGGGRHYISIYDFLGAGTTSLFTTSPSLLHIHIISYNWRSHLRQWSPSPSFLDEEKWSLDNVKTVDFSVRVTRGLAMKWFACRSEW